MRKLFMMVTVVFLLVCSIALQCGLAARPALQTAAASGETGEEVFGGMGIMPSDYTTTPGPSDAASYAPTTGRRQRHQTQNAPPASTQSPENSEQGAQAYSNPTAPSPTATSTPEPIPTNPPPEKTPEPVSLDAESSEQERLGSDGNVYQTEITPSEPTPTPTPTPPAETLAEATPLLLTESTAAPISVMGLNDVTLSDYTAPAITAGETFSLKMFLSLFYQRMEASGGNGQFTATNQQPLVFAPSEIAVTISEEYNEDCPLTSESFLKKQTLAAQGQGSGYVEFHNLRVRSDASPGIYRLRALVSYKGPDNVGQTKVLNLSIEVMAPKIEAAQPIGGITADTEDEQPLDEISSETEDEQPFDGITSETEDEQPFDGITSDTEEEQPFGSITTETEDEQPLDGISSETEDEQLFDGITSDTEEEQPFDSITTETEDEQPFDGITTDTEDEQPFDSISSEIEDEQPFDGITSETADEQPLDEITSETADEQPLDDSISNTKETFLRADNEFLLEDTQQCVVEFVDHDGRLIATQRVSQGGAAITPEDPTRKSSPDSNVRYRFIGWQSNPEGITTDCITEDVRFTAIYQLLELVTFTINYQLDEPNAQITLPPARTFHLIAGEQAQISEASPFLMGYEPDLEIYTFDGIVPPNMESVTITYSISTDLIDYQVRYFLEKPGISETPMVGNPAQFEEVTQDFEESSGPFGFMFSPQKQYDGFILMAQNFSPLTQTTVYEVYYQRSAINIFFDTGEGASYHPPIEGKYGQAIGSLPTPTRIGYTFEGWEPALSTFPEKDTELCAIWTPQDARVQIIYWVEKANISHDTILNIYDDSQFEQVGISDYSKIHPVNAVGEIFLPVGSTPVFTPPQRLKTDESDALVASYLGYRASDDAVRGDGTTVIHVYYQRDVFTWVFNAIMPENVTGYFPDGETSYTVKFKFEEYVGDRWPKDTEFEPTTDDGKGVQVWYSGETYGGDPEFTKPTIATVSLLPKDGDTANWVLWWVTKSAANEKHLICYFEALPGEEASEGHDLLTVDGVDYIRDGGGNYYSQTYYSDFSIYGFSVYGMDSPKELETDEPGTTIFLFKREKHPITFNAGSAGTQIAPPTTCNDVSYETPLASLDPGWSDQTTYRDSVTGVVYTFAGWYKQQQLYDPFDFATETMPNNGLTLYAKWESHAVTVTFVYPDGTEFAKIEDIPAGSQMTDFFPQSEPSLPGMLFSGWYLNGSMFTSTTRVSGDVTVEARFKPLTVSYRVLYICASGEEREIWPAKVVSNRYVDDVIATPSDEYPVDIPGYIAIDTGDSSITLTADSEDNVITFYYKYIEGKQANYRVHCLVEETGDPTPFDTSSEILSSNMMVLVVWAPQDESGKYYPTTPYWRGSFSEDGVTDITFYYREYEEISYTEAVFLVGSKNNGEMIYSKTSAGNIGQTASVQFPDTIYTDPDGVRYAYYEGDPNTVNGVVIQRGGGPYDLKLYYYQLHTVTFVSNDISHGTLEGETIYADVRHGTSFSEIVKPTPNPAEGYYFSGWIEPSGTYVIDDSEFIAEFLKREPLLIQLENLEITYDGQTHTLSNEFTLIVAGEEATHLTVSGITASGASGLNAGSYPSTIENRDDLIVLNDNMQNITSWFTPSFVDGCLTILPKGNGDNLPGEGDPGHFYGTITIDSQYKLFGESDPELTYTALLTGLVGDDELSFLISREPGEQIGEYKIKLDWDDSYPTKNYDLTAVKIEENILTIDGMLRWVDPSTHGMNGMDLDFGTQTLPVGPVEYQSTPSKNHMLSVEDSRLNPGAWHVEVELGIFESDGGSSFRGTITLSDPTSSDGRLTVEDSITMHNGGSALVMTANENAGNGTFEVIWPGEHISLSLASDEISNVRKGEYQAAIVWTIIDAP